MSASARPLPLAARLPTLLAHGRGLSRRYDLLARSYLLCLCSMFLVTGNTIPQSLYYVVVLPLAALSGLRFARRVLGTSIIFWAVTVYLTVIGLSSLLQPRVDLAAVGGYFRRTAMVLSFLLATAYLATRSRRFLPSALVALSVAAALGALFSMAAVVWTRPLHNGLGGLRLVASIGLPGYENSTNIALTYATLLVGGAAAVMTDGLALLERRLLYAAAGVLVVALLMAQSRGPLIAALLAILAAAAALGRRRVLLATLAAAIAGSVAFDIVPALHKALLARGESYRFELWQHYLAMAADRPWTGYGLFTDIRTRLPKGLAILHPHNLLLSAEIRGGALASLALVAWLAATFYWSGRLSQTRRGPIPLALLLTVSLAGTVDYEIFSTSPDWFWVTFWLPVGACLGAEMALRRAAALNRRAEPP